MTQKQSETIREGLNKIAKCYESNYRDYITNLGNDKFESEKFSERMKTVDRMRENWEKLIVHFINLEYDSYKPVDEVDRLTREVRLNEWRCLMSDTLIRISSHWVWLVQEPQVCSNLLRSHYLYKDSQDKTLNNSSNLDANL